jgi:proton-coupled amino acid transporter
MLLMVTVFCSVGTLSYLAFGDKVETVVLLNLPSNSVMVVIIQLLYTLAILFSVPLQMFPAIGILENLFFEPGAGKTSMMVKWEKNLLRFGVALVVAIVADLGSDNLDRFVSLIGSFACIPLSFIYPSLFHLKGVATTLRQKAVDVGMIAFGLLMMLYVTIVTIQGWGDASVPHNRCS